MWTALPSVLTLMLLVGWTGSPLGAGEPFPVNGGNGGNASLAQRPDAARPHGTESRTLRVVGTAGVISPYAIRGFNYGLSMPVVLHLSEFAALRVAGLRFPPGNDADNYPLTTDMLDAFKRQWEILERPDVLIVANFFEGPEHAVRVARYLDLIGLPVRSWAVGNEPDLYQRNRMSPEWTAEVYCQRFREFAIALKEVDSENRLSGPAVSGSRPSGQEFLREVLYRCGDVIDVLSWHVYPTDGTWQDEAALATSRQVAEEIRTYRAWLADPLMNPRGYDREIAVAITEFGLSWRTTNFRHLEDMTAALWLADVLGQSATNGLDFGYYFALQAMGGHGLIDSSGWIRHTYYVFEMLSDFSGRALALEVEGDPEAGETELLTAYGATNERGIRLLFVNRSHTAVQFRLEAGRGDPVLEVRTLNDEIFEDDLSYRRSSQSADEPVLVPALSVVLVSRGV